MLYYLHCFKHKQERESLTGTFVLFIRLVKFNVLFLIKSAFHTQDLIVQEKKYARNTQSSPGTRYHVYKAYSTLTPSIFLSPDAIPKCVILATKIFNNYNGAWPDFYSKL